MVGAYVHRFFASLSAKSGYVTAIVQMDEKLNSSQRWRESCRVDVYIVLVSNLFLVVDICRTPTMPKMQILVLREHLATWVHRSRSILIGLFRMRNFLEMLRVVLHFEMKFASSQFQVTLVRPDSFSHYLTTDDRS